MSHDELDLVVVGNAVIDRIHQVTLIPSVDSSAFVLDERKAPGGVEANVAAAAARLGLRVGVIARIGSDPDGQLIAGDLQERGIDTSRLQIGDPSDTAYSLIFVDGHGDRIIMTGGQGVRRLKLNDADIDYIRGARVCFASAYLLGPMLDQVSRICTEADGPLFAFDLPDNFEDLAARGLTRDHVLALLPRTDLFMANRRSLQSYTGAESINQGIQWLYERGVSRVSVSDGAAGLHVFDSAELTPDEPVDNAVHFVPSVPLEIVDTSGAGDVLHGALISQWLLLDRSAVEAGRFAAAAAALSCQGWGVRAALPTREATEQLLAAEWIADKKGV